MPAVNLPHSLYDALSRRASEAGTTVDESLSVAIAQFLCEPEMSEAEYQAACDQLLEDIARSVPANRDPADIDSDVDAAITGVWADRRAGRR